MRLRGLIWALALGFLAQAAPLHYDLDVTVTSVGDLSGILTLSGIVAGDWQELVFRLYPAGLSPDCLRPLAAASGGEVLEWDQVHPTAFIVPLEASPGQTFSLTLSFAGEVPELSRTQGYGTYARSPQAMVLAQAYPLLAPWRDGTWLVEPVFPWGDAVVAEVADYSARVTLPPGWTLVATGGETQTAPGVYLVGGRTYGSWRWWPCVDTRKPAWRRGRCRSRGTSSRSTGRPGKPRWR